MDRRSEATSGAGSTWSGTVGEDWSEVATSGGGHGARAAGGTPPGVTAETFAPGSEPSATAATMSSRQASTGAELATFPTSVQDVTAEPRGMEWKPSAEMTLWETTTTTTRTTTDDRYRQEDAISGLQDVLGQDGGQSRDLVPLTLAVVIALAIVGNLVVCVAVKVDRRLHQMTYYFFVSMAILHITMATLVMPPGVIIVLAGKFPYSEELCKLWITSDFFFCNSTSLHLAFVNMDTFLRLKDPVRHGRVNTTCSLLLWLGAPWAISTVQSVAQFMLSQEDSGLVRGQICFIGDKNFIILGTLFSFVIPTAISVIFYGLCVHELRLLRAGKLLDDSESSNHAGYRYGSNESIVDDDDDDGGSSDTASCLTDDDEDDDDGGGGALEPEREEVQLAVVANLKSDCGRLGYGRAEETTSFCGDAGRQRDDDDDGRFGRANAAFRLGERPGAGCDQGPCTLLLRDAAAAAGGHAHPSAVAPGVEHEHCSPDEILRKEAAASRLMFLLLLFSITLWVPYSASNVVYGTCAHCRDNMSFAEVMTFKWLAYSSAVVGPWIYVKFSEPLRQVILSLLQCQYCK